MLSRLLDSIRGLIRGRGMIIKGTGKLPEGEARKVDIGDVIAGGRQVLLCRIQGNLHAIDAECPHEGGRISPGPLIDGLHVMCPLHMYKFDPRNGANVGALCGSAKVYKTREKDGDTEIWM